MSLHIDLMNFDGKGLAVLEDIRTNTPHSPEVLEELVDIIGEEDKNMQTGASWLLRTYLQDGAKMTSALVGRLALGLASVHDGFGRLHLCQAMDDIRVPPRASEAFAEFFRSSAASKNTFLRAWAPHGMFQLALQHDDYAPEAQTMVETALADPAASVRARARRTLAGE